MSRTLTIVVTAMLVLSMIGVSTVVLADDSEPVEDEDGVAPGEQLNGALGVQQAELDGEVRERGFGVSIANATTNESKADIVAARMEIVEERITTLEERKDDLDAAYNADEISTGTYNAELAKLEAERASLERQANQSATVAGELPTASLADRGVSVSHILEIRDRADELGGPEIAAIAQEIAGPDVGAEPADRGQERIPTDTGPPDDRGASVVDDDDSADRPDGASSERP